MGLVNKRLLIILVLRGKGEKMKKIKLDLNMNDIPSNITWRTSGKSIIINMANSDIDLELDMGEDTIRQLRQALSWVSEKKSA